MPPHTLSSLCLPPRLALLGPPLFLMETPERDWSSAYWSGVDPDSLGHSTTHSLLYHCTAPTHHPLFLPLIDFSRSPLSLLCFRSCAVVLHRSVWPSHSPPPTSGHPQPRSPATTLSHSFPFSVLPFHLTPPRAGLLFCYLSASRSRLSSVAVRSVRGPSTGGG